MKDLTVEIPHKYKKALIERFSLKNAKKINRKISEAEIFEINKRCPLCKNYWKHSGCGKCPFVKFESDFMPTISAGCLLWMKRLITYREIQPYIRRIWWFVADDKKARKELKLLKKKATKLIKWV